MNCIKKSRNKPCRLINLLGEFACAETNFICSRRFYRSFSSVKNVENNIFNLVVTNNFKKSDKVKK